MNTVSVKDFVGHVVVVTLNAGAFQHEGRLLGLDVFGIILEGHEVTTSKKTHQFIGWRQVKRIDKDVTESGAV